MSEKPHSSVTTKSLATVSEANTNVDVSRIETPKGQRLELSDPATEASVWLDAVVLESLTWQDAETFHDLCRDGPGHIAVEDLAVTRDIHDDSQAPLTSITNEFSHVDIRKTATEEREWIEVHGPKVGFTIRLNAVALSTLLYQDHEHFTDLLTQKLNP